MSSSTTCRARPTSRVPPRRPGITWSGWWTRAAAGASRSRCNRALGTHLARLAIGAKPEIHGVAHEPLARPLREAHLAHQHRPHPVVLGPARRAAARERAALGGERAEPRGELVQALLVEARAGAARIDERVAVVDAQVDGAQPRARPLRVRVAADHELLALDALDLAPLGAAAAQVARVGPLRHHSLQARLAGGVQERRAIALDVVGVAHRSGRRQELAEERLAVGEREAAEIPPEEGRSEEHTSELQSLAYLVCRLLLEKKKKQKK